MKLLKTLKQDMDSLESFKLIFITEQHMGAAVKFILRTLYKY